MPLAPRPRTERDPDILDYPVENSRGSPVNNQTMYSRQKDADSAGIHSPNPVADSKAPSTSSLSSEALSDSELEGYLHEDYDEDESDIVSEQEGLLPLIAAQKNYEEAFLPATNRKRRRKQIPQLGNSDLLSSQPAVLLLGTSVVVLGVDISHLSRSTQFFIFATGVFGFNLLFGYLQEFISVEICNRQLGLFLAVTQFTGYTVISFILRSYLLHKEDGKSRDERSTKNQVDVPSYMYLGLGVLSGIDMAMTNMAMLYINYPAKTLMKSSRVIFTMLFGVLLAHKKYLLRDYLIVFAMVLGLFIFMQADATSSAVFKPMGVFMLVISLLCDGAINIISENIMKDHGIGQDELIFRMYSLALFTVTAAATLNGDMQEGVAFLFQPGTYDEWQGSSSEETISWSVGGKIGMIILFSTMGFFGTSCSAAITKNFGALTMSITSTVRRATTLFISFLLFDNDCTFVHVMGAVVFISALTLKSVLSGNASHSSGSKMTISQNPVSPRESDLEDLVPVGLELQLPTQVKGT